MIPIRTAVREIDPRIAMLTVTTMEMFMGESLTRQRLTSLLLRDAGWVIGVGAVIGLGLSVVVSRLIGAVFLGTAGVSPSVLAACVVTLSVAAFVATLLPARRASRLDPMRTLRQE